MSIAFISSAIKELESEREVAKETLLSLGFQEIILWEDLPAQSHPPREVFLREVDRSKIFILILWQKYSGKVIEEIERARKRQIPILVFIKNIKEDWGEKQDPKLQNFIDSLTHPSSWCSWKSFRKLSEFRLALIEAVMSSLFERLETPFLTHSRKDIYEYVEKIASSARKRVILLARSLILITGPRPYLSDTPIDYEKSTYVCLLKLFQKAKGGQIKFSSGYLIPTTITELITYPKLKDFAKKQLSKLFDNSSSRKPQSLFSLATTSTERDLFFTFIVGDDQFATWFKDPFNPELDICISSKDRIVADALVHIFEEHCKVKPLKTLLGELQL